jgi:tetratricopeptide (TPR) repeat protein
MNQPSQPLLPSHHTTATIKKYTQMLAQNPENPEIHVKLGNLYAQQAQWQKAIFYYQKAVKLNPQLPETHRNLARVYLKIGNENKAADFWYKAVKLEPNESQIEQYIGLGNTFQAQKKFNKAANCYRQAIKIKPDLLSVYDTLAKLLKAQDKQDQIIAVYRQGVKKNPQKPEFHLALAQVLASQKQWQPASNRFRLALNLDSSLAIGYYNWGYVLSQMKKWQKAKNCYQKVIKLNPESWEAYYQLGLIFKKEKQWENAKDCYQKVINLNQEFVSGYLQLALVYQNTKQYQLALEHCHQALEIAPEASPLEEQVIVIYQEILNKYPKLNPNLYYKFGKLLRKKSRFQDAIAAYEKTISIEPNFRLAHIDIQYTFIAPEQLPQHINFYQQIVAKHPEVAIAWGNLGDALTAQNNIQEAITCYRKSCYLQAVETYPELAKLQWKEAKESSPDFIIVGAAKCGTTSLNRYLSHHPQVLLPHKKELDFFWKKYDYGIDWYLAHFPPITDQEEFITGEATPNYIRSPLAAQRIKQHFPNIKLILLLRNPIDRAISWHYHKLNHGQVKEALKTAILTEIENLSSFSEADIVNSGYYQLDSVLSSLYIYKVRAWLELFSREQILILKSEDFYSDPAITMKEVYDFLKLPDYSLAQYPKINGGSYNPADAEIRNILRDYFEPYNQQLETYLGMKFNWS